MERLKKIGDWFKGIPERIKGKGHRIVCFLVAGVIVIGLLGVWLFGTHTGLLARTSFEKSFDNDDIKIVTVYDSNGTILREYTGTWGVENYNGHYSIMNFSTGERIDIYGATSIIIDEAPIEEE